MADSAIEWTDKTWNPVRGCSVISPGCVNCYAMKQAHRFSGSKMTPNGHGSKTLLPAPYHGLTKQTKAGPQWTGKVRTIPSALEQPLRWKKPARVFVNSMSDLFHEDVPDTFIDRVFAIMSLASQHTFQILTKRAARMNAYWSMPVERARAIDGAIWSALGSRRGSRIKHGGNWRCLWPLPNVWLGVSVENQHFADERIPLLLQTPAAVRFISAEPLLGPVNLGLNLGVPLADGTKWAGTLPILDWVIVGGESGIGARPFDVQWGRSIVKQCRAAGVPVFMKQLGAKPEIQQGCGDCDPCCAGQRCALGYNVGMELRSKKGGDMDEWPEDLRVREFP